MIWKLVLRISILSLAVFILNSSNCINNAKELDTEGYMLVFVQDVSHQIRVRYSRNGRNWESSNFREVPSILGVGAASDTGIKRIVPWSNMQQQVEVVSGWTADGFEKYNSATTSQIVTSAPSAVYGIKNQWIITYKNQSNRIKVKIYDEKEDTFLDTECVSIESPLNINVIGRPAIVRKGNQILLAWRNNARFQNLILANGVLIDTGCINWERIVQFEIPSGELAPNAFYTGNAFSAPTLTQDQNRFWIGYTILILNLLE